jgi:hypothetical protein
MSVTSAQSTSFYKDGRDAQYKQDDALLNTQQKHEVQYDKDHPRTSHEHPEGEQRYSSTLSLTSALDVGMGGQIHSSAALLSGRRPRIHCTEVSVGPRAAIDGCVKPHPHRDSIPRPSSPYRVAIPTALSTITEVNHDQDPTYPRRNLRWKGTK